MYFDILFHWHDNIMQRRHGRHRSCHKMVTHRQLFNDRALYFGSAAFLQWGFIKAKMLCTCNELCIFDTFDFGNSVLFDTQAHYSIHAVRNCRIGTYSFYHNQSEEKLI